MVFQLLYKKVVVIFFRNFLGFFYIIPEKVHMSSINLISESFFSIVKKKQLFQLFNQFFPKYISSIDVAQEKSTLSSHPRDVKIQDYPRIPSSSVRQGCVGDPGLILIDEFFFFLRRTVCRTQGFFLITLTFKRESVFAQVCF